MHMLNRRLVMLSLATVAGLSVSCETASGPRVDGDIAEWSPESVVKSDGHHVYLRFKVPGEPAALQASERTVALYLDTDGNAETGRRSTAKVFRQLGVDAEIQFSPRNADGKPGRGMKVVRVESDGKAKTIANKTSGVVFSPTYASTWYEMRFDRALLGVTTPGQNGAATSTRFTGMFVMLDEKGQINGWADPFEMNLGPAATTPKVATMDVPSKPRGAVRVVSYNVEKSKPVTTPEGFARVLTLLDADVVLFQEWDQGDAAALEAWLKQHAPGEIGGPVWKVRKTDDTGTAVASRLPLMAMSPDSLWMSDGTDKPRQVRVASAIVTTPGGPLSLTSVHLKCCGGATGREEEIRRSEARAIQQMLGSAEPVVARMIAGDFNLVGTRMPLDIMREGLDTNGGDLAVAEPIALGGDVKATWREWSSEFSPGRLDYVLYTPSRATVVNTFVLDSTILADETLARTGLDRGDSESSDHMPVVVDVVVK
jgi:endonuclease/exonuclease/phosphatase family metal-dependent hydrolase